MNKKVLIGIGVVAILGYLWYTNDKKTKTTKVTTTPAVLAEEVKVA